MSAGGVRLDRLDDPVPHARLLGTGRYAVLVSGAGSGRSTWDRLAVTAWSADPTEDADGFFFYLRDEERGTVWSLGHQPVPVPAERYDASWRPGVVRIARLENEIAASMEIAVSPDDDVEVRRIHLQNCGPRARRLSLTSYAEVVIQEEAAYASHPAFSRLFVQTAYVAEQGVLVAERRPRSADERRVSAAHALVADAPLQYETDRVGFIGRGRSRAAPLALVSDAPLFGTAGAVLDPIFSLRRTFVLPPGGAVIVSALLAAGETRDAVVGVLARHATPEASAAVIARAEREARALLGRLCITEAEAERFSDLAGAMLYGGGVGRTAHSLVILAAEPEGAALAAELAKAGAYWRAFGLEVEPLVVRGEDAADVRARASAVVPAPRATARRGRLRPHDALVALGTTTAPPALFLDNGYGGFTADGSEYVLPLDRGRPPMPWTNVVANEQAGFLVSESGATCTWTRNSREHRLTPWYNDPVADPYGEALYVRDEESGVAWSPLPGPIPGPGAYEVRHGFGYSRWRHASHGLEQEVSLFVPRTDPLRIASVRVTNTSGRDRRLSLFSYARLVPSRAITTEIEATTGTIYARNPLGGDLAGGVTFAAAVAPAGASMHATADRLAFIGRHGSPAWPAALGDARLDGVAGAGLDPCAALQVEFRIAAGETADVAFLLGEAAEGAAGRALVARYRRRGAVATAFGDARAAWDELLSAVRIATPSPGLDVLVNGWLMYQNVSCRLWGRSAFYQSGGAFGFRDQLQDAAALVWNRPDATRAQILLHAAHQFVEGDVLHWWHPPASRGTRTRFSDDLLWLPYVVATYVEATGDRGVLDESVPFLTARPLGPGEDDAYLLPSRAAEEGSVYEHCCRALDRSLTRGAHGLPLMGTGDWNDGMNRVGREGRGESVWLGFFLYEVLRSFIAVAETRGDAPHASRWRAYREELRGALETSGWDGAWYRRAYYDDGTPLGSATSDECRIDALVQAWAVISGAAPRARAEQAIEAAERHLVDEDPGIVRLLTPPFDRTPHDPGYIKGYLPGIRENGGQYTHAALWVVRAEAELGRRERAARLLELIGPVHHARDRAAVARYQVEPYVVAADIYGVAPHRGRGGWTWYTGSAGWMYRVTLESILGLRLEGGRALRVAPCIPDAWPGFAVRLRRPDGTRWQIDVENPARDASAVVAVSIDGMPAEVVDGAARLPLAGDGAEHRAVITLGRAPDRCRRRGEAAPDRPRG